MKVMRDVGWQALRYLVKVLPAGRGDRSAYAELIGIRLAGHLHNGQPCALHRVACMPGAKRDSYYSLVHTCQALAIVKL